MTKTTVFDYISTKLSADDKRVMVINISKDSPSFKFQILQPDDLLISKSDFLAKIQDNILVVEEVKDLGGTAVEISARGLSKITMAIDEFLDGEQFLFLGRAEKQLT
jgi:hypothetical protein